MEPETTHAEQHLDRAPAVANSCLNVDQNRKPKIVVIMGATGSGKSKLAIDLASHFPIEVINADSMQVYQGLDVLTNKVPVEEQKGVPHHLLGNISPNVEFTAKDFRENAVPLINEILSRNRLPVIVGGTNYYIQALVSQYLLDDCADDQDSNCLQEFPGDGDELDVELQHMSKNCDYSHRRLENLDPVAANRIHPNDDRKIKQYISLYERCGVLPSKLYQGNTMENWGRVDNLRYDCCFICVDASLQAADQYVNQRVDLMVDSGLIKEVCDIYLSNSDYTKGLRQAIGVREFEDFLRGNASRAKLSKEEFLELVNSSSGVGPNIMLTEAIEKVKLNTRRLVRRQKRRLKRLQVLFGWNIHYLDVTNCMSCSSYDSWNVDVVQPSVQIINSFLNKTADSNIAEQDCMDTKLTDRDLWTRYICQACGSKELRGAHEWEQHLKGRVHRKRVSSLRKNPNHCPQAR